MRLLLTAALSWAAASPAFADDLTTPPPPPIHKPAAPDEAKPASSAPPHHHSTASGEQADAAGPQSSGKVTYGDFGPHPAPDTAKPPKGWTAQTP